MKKKLLYLDIEFRKKTRATDFLIELLQAVYDISFVWCSSVKNGGRMKFDEENSADSEDTEFDVLVLFQVLPPRLLVDGLFKYQKGVFFPMYDTAVGLSVKSLIEYRDFLFINFCKNLHIQFQKDNINTCYIQFFPKPKYVPSDGENTVFLWQRRNIINVDVVEKLFDGITLKKIHIHNVPDPGSDYAEVNEKLQKVTEYSTWLPNRDDISNLIKNYTYYIAPRPYEGIGMGFLEAMAMGRCVIAPDYPTLNEYIENGVNGYLYDIYNPKAIKLKDASYISENAYQGIVRGYSEWEERKENIIEWIEGHNQTYGERVGIRKNKLYAQNLAGIIEEYTEYNKLLNMWLDKKQKKKRPLEEYFLDRNLQNIAIYGLGELGRKLYEELKHSKVKISCTSDRRPIAICGVPAVSADNIPADLDAIIVTPFTEYEQICSDILKSCTLLKISLIEVIMEW